MVRTDYPRSFISLRAVSSVVWAHGFLILLVILLVILLACMTGCTGSRRAFSEPLSATSPTTTKTNAQANAVQPELPMPKVNVTGALRDSGSLSSEYQTQWTKKMRGAVSGLSLSGGENDRSHRILVATSPDADIQGSAGHPLLTLLNGNGRLLWEKKMALPVKEQDISRDGAMIVISHYSGEIMAWNSVGRLLWTAEGNCRPQIFRFSKKILCYHDDDADPRIAFDLLDWDGRKLGSFPIDGDVLALKLSQDEKHLVLGLTHPVANPTGGGKLAYFNLNQNLTPGATNLTPAWVQPVDGEMVDVAVADANGVVGSVAAAAVIRSVGGGGKGKVVDQSVDSHQVMILGEKGTPLRQFKSDVHLDQIEFSSDSSKLYFYSNHQTGQQWGAWDLRSSASASSWIRLGLGPAEYSSRLTVFGNSVWVGYEADLSADESSVRSHLLAMSSAGELISDLFLSSNVKMDEEAHLYAYRVGAGVLAIATDDAKVSLLFQRPVQPHLATKKPDPKAAPSPGSMPAPKTPSPVP